MSRHTQVTCDNEACGFEDGTDGETNWITIKRKKAINADVCSDGCLAAWVKDQPSQAALEFERTLVGTR